MGEVIILDTVSSFLSSPEELLYSWHLGKGDVACSRLFLAGYIVVSSASVDAMIGNFSEGSVTQ